MGQIAAYIRVSSKSQHFTMQKAAIEWASTARKDTVSLWYKEKASSKTMQRPELLRLLADARAGRISKVYVFKYDRLCRSGIRDLLNVLEEFKNYGCQVVAINDELDLSGPAAEMILAALAFAAKLERQAINERISAARVRIEAEGGHWGRPIKVTNLNDMQRMRSEGKTIREISIACKVPRSSVARYLGEASAASA